MSLYICIPPQCYDISEIELWSEGDSFGSVLLSDVVVLAFLGLVHASLDWYGLVFVFVTVVAPAV